MMTKSMMHTYKTETTGGIRLSSLLWNLHKKNGPVLVAGI